MVIRFLEQFGQASRKDIDSLLRDKLSDSLTDKQRHDKIGNLLSDMRRKGQIFNDGPRSAPSWKLSTNGENPTKESTRKRNPVTKE
jgi:ATP-dependent DNA helicase RecG